MKKNSLFIILIVALLATVALGCSTSTNNESTSDESTSDLPEINFKLGHPVAEDTPAHQAALKLAEIVAEKTNGKFTIDVLGNDLLGPQRELLEGLRTGTTDMTVSPTTNMSNMYPRLNLLNLPFLYTDKEHGYKTADGEIGQGLYDELEEETGVKTLGIYLGGFRHIGNSKKEITSPKDVEGLKIRATDSPINIDTLEALGANAVPMAFGELFTALQQGTVDGQDSPLANIYASKLYEVQPYLTITDLYFATFMVTIGEEAWNELPEDYQNILVDAAKESETYQRELTDELEDEYLQKIKDYGVEVTELSPEQKQAFKEKGETVWEKHEEDIPRESIEEVLSLSK